MTLDEFISEAKLACYASGDKYRITSHREFCNSYSNDEYSFEDSYVGARSFSGMEIVWEGDHNKPVWCMVYSGKELSPLGEEGLKFLQTCLRLGAERGSVRGPSSVTIDDYSYSFTLNFDNIGRETILKGGEIIFSCIVIVNSEIIE